MAKSWDNASYPKREQVLVQSANIDSNLTHFPLLLVLTDTNAIANADIASKRYQVYDYNGNKMSYEEDTYAEGASYANAKIWVGGSSTTVYASPSGDQNTFWIYYGYDPGSDQDNATGVFGEYNAVWHMTDLADSSGNSHTLSNDGAVSGATGKIGDGYDFEASENDYMNINDHADWDFSGAFTLEAWANPETTSADAHILWRYSSVDGGIGYFLGIQNSPNCWELTVFIGGSYIQTRSNAAPSGGMQHIAATRDSSGNTAIYIDGVAQTDTDTLSGAISDAHPLYIGRQDNITKDFDGILDEIRIRASDLSAAWLKFQHANINEADNEQTWSAEEDKPSGSALPLRCLMGAGL